MSLFTRPIFEDRQIVQYSGTSINLSGETYINNIGLLQINSPILDFTGTTSASTLYTLAGVSGYINEGLVSSFIVQPPILLQSGATGTTTVDVTGFVLGGLDSDGRVTWVPAGSTSASCITDLYVTNIHGCSPIHIQPTSSDDVYIVEGGGNVGIGVTSATTRLHVSGTTIINSDNMMLSDTLTTIPTLPNFKGLIVSHDYSNNNGIVSLNTNPTGSTAIFFANDSLVTGQIGVGGSQSVRAGSPIDGVNFYRNKIVIRGNSLSDGMVFNPNSGNLSGTFWWEFAGISGMILKGNGGDKAYLGLALNPDGTEMPTSNLQIGGTGTTGTFQYKDGNQSEGKILTSDTDGNVSWQTSPNTFFTDDITTSGNTDINGYRILYPFTATTSGDYIFDATTRVDLAGVSPTNDITTLGVVNGTVVTSIYRTTIGVGMTVTHTEKKKITLLAGDVFHYGVVNPVTTVHDGAMIVFKIS